MRCKEAMHKLNDLFDRTLTAREEQEVQAHLAACPACRSEFQLIKNADDMLRAAVLEMVAEIEVPANLSQRIVQALAGEKRRSTGMSGLFGFLRTPAFAAAMLMLVAATGLFGYYKLFFSPGGSPAVVLSNESQPAAGSAGGTGPAPLSGAAESPAQKTTGDGAGETEPAPLYGAAGPEQSRSTFKDSTSAKVPDEAATPVTPITTMMAGSTNGSAGDTGVPGAEDIARQNAPPGRGGGEFYDSTEQEAKNLKDAPIITDDDSVLMAGSQSPDTGKLSISSRAALRQGTLQEATREVGFTPALPRYLPPEAELIDVTWGTRAIYLNYQAGPNFFMITQSRVTEVVVTGYEGGQLIDLNGAKALLQETSPGGDQSWFYTTVRWQRDEWVFTVEGELPSEEILKIAMSIYI
jgi:hypothetical protein